MNRPFRDRAHAGRQLAEKLARFRGASETIVLALPRGGVVVAAEIASALKLPLDVCLVRKLGVPWQPELAMGALAMDGVVVLHDELIAEMGIPQREVEREIALEKLELGRRDRLYRGERPFPDLRGKTVILVDDGIATGATAEAAIRAARQAGAAQVVVAVGVAAASTVRRLRREATEVVAAVTPADLDSIGEWFDDFAQTTDDEVRRCLKPAP